MSDSELAERNPVHLFASAGAGAGRDPRLAYVIALGFLQTLSTLTIDIYLPAFPKIAQGLSVPASSIQFTFTATMVGMVVGQFVVGPLSDQYGRKSPMLIATAVHICASVACASAPSIAVLILARCLQGAAAASTGVLALSMVRDLYSGLRLMRMLGSMALISGIAITVGPLIGSLLLSVMDWRGIFVCLAGYGLLVGAGIVALVGETLPPAKRRPGGLRARASGLRRVLADRVYIGLVAVTSLAWGGMYAYLASSSFLFQRVFGLSEIRYGVVFASHAFTMLLGTQFGTRMGRRLQPRRTIMFSTAGLAVSAAALLLVGAVQGPAENLFAVLGPLWLFTFFLGVNTPCIQALALDRHGADAGTASSTLNATRQGLGAVVTPVAGLIGITSAVPVGALMATGQILGVVALWTLVRPRRLHEIT